MTKRIALLLLFVAAAVRADVAEKVDAIFASYATKDAPGCAIGVAQGGKIVLERAYGMANLEYDIPLTPESIFEAGSVSKQFTAAAVLTLAADGKLSLDDPLRKYIPELDPSASAITIRQILSHTSGLRDWGTIVGLSGWRRGTRLVTHAHVLEVIGKQHALNFAPGTQWSYSNSGYNLAAMLVERVSGKSFSDFTRERLFIPNGMTHSSWRDDYTRVVKGRATAYDPNDQGGYNADMDIENIYGNCCLLTTVGDLLRWNLNFDGSIRDQMQTPTKLANGTTTDYGLGLFIGEGGDVFHSGATAGWRAYLLRRPKGDVSIAMLCNRGDAAGGNAEKVAAAFGAPASPPAGPQASTPATAPDGLYVDPKTHAFLRIKDNAIARGPKLTPLAADRFRAGRAEIRFEGDTLHLITNHKPEAVYTKMPEAAPKLEDYTGTYTSDEVGATYRMVIEKGKLTAKLAPADSFTLEPTYPDGFTAGGPLLHFTRDAKGRVDGVDIKADVSPGDGSARVERVHFTRVK